MVTLPELWQPILAAAVLVFVVSSVLHMVLPLHKSDYTKVPGEDELAALMRARGVRPGSYMFPFCADMKDLGSDEMKAKYLDGPVGFMRILPNGQMKIGKFLGTWFAYTILISVVVAYIGGLALAPGAEYLKVFQVTGATAFLAYGLAAIPESIWKGQSWGTTAKFVFDGLLYGLVTGGAFGWLWPGVSIVSGG
ncbi:MAG: hypothetical protein R3F49_04615 [Planctomycetota bacterium]